MDSQGEKFVPDSTGNQVSFGGVPSNQPDQNVSLAQNDASASDGNVAQHILGGINNPQDEAAMQNSNTPLDTPIAQPNQVISSADVAPVDPMEAAQVHAALSHPYFSNHPTQTAASGVGDIILNNQTNNTKRRIPRPALLAVIVVAVILAISGIAILIGSFNKNSESARPISASEAVVAIKNNIEQVKYLEDLFYISQFDRVNFEEVFNDETSKKINQAVGSIAQLKKDLDRFSFAENGDSLQQIYIVNARDALNQRAGQYINTVNLYNQVFEAYKNGDEAFFNELSASENQDESAVGQRFADFFSTKNYWQEKMTEQECKSNPTTTNCKEAQKYYDQNQSSFSSNAPIPRMLFAVYISTPYSQSSLVYNDLELAIEETDSER